MTTKFVVASGKDIITTLEQQGYTFTPDQLKSRLITVSRRGYGKKSASQKTARVYRPAVIQCLAELNNVRLTSAERANVEEALKSMSMASRRGRPRHNKERLANSAPRFYTVGRNGLANIPVAAFFDFKNTAENKVKVEYSGKKITITVE